MGNKEMGEKLLEIIEDAEGKILVIDTYPEFQPYEIPGLLTEIRRLEQIGKIKRIPAYLHGQRNTLALED